MHVVRLLLLLICLAFFCTLGVFFSYYYHFSQQINVCLPKGINNYLCELKPLLATGQTIFVFFITMTFVIVLN